MLFVYNYLQTIINVTDSPGVISPQKRPVRPGICVSGPIVFSWRVSGYAHTTATTELIVLRGDWYLQEDLRCQSPAQIPAPP
jgi:hypothetical protein